MSVAIREKREFKYIGTGKFHIPLADVDEENRPINKILKTGDVVVSVRDMVTLWPNKFVQVTTEIAAQSQPAMDLTDRVKLASPSNVKTVAGKEMEDKENKKIDQEQRQEKAQESLLGEDVTSDFEGASPRYQVFQDMKDFYVVRTGESTPLHENPLKQTRVKRFIRSLENPDDE